MFLKRRIAELDRRLRELEDKVKCDKGEHLWILNPHFSGNGPGYIKCAICHERPEVKP